MIDEDFRKRQYEDSCRTAIWCLRLMALLALAALLFGCDSNYYHEDLIRRADGPFIPFTRIYDFELEGHMYYKFVDGSNCFVVVHNPNCKCLHGK